METKIAIVTQKDKRLDEIVFLEYGHLEYFEEVLELNIGAIEQQMHLPQGIELKLPIYQREEKIKEVEASKLW